MQQHVLAIAIGLAWSVPTHGQSGNAQVQMPASEATDLDASAFQARIKMGDGVLVDVRTPREFAAGHIEGALNLDWTASDYEKHFGALDTAKPILVYCAVGGRSGQAKEYLEGKGYRVFELTEGGNAWKTAGLPLVK